jgi:hypothetical protein
MRLDRRRAQRSSICLITPWSYGEVDGREVGYSIAATCDHPGCKSVIDRGLAYACGGKHGETEYSCGGYFCAEHLSGWTETPQGKSKQVCAVCDATPWHGDVTPPPATL